MDLEVGFVDILLWPELHPGGHARIGRLTLDPVSYVLHALLCNVAADIRLTRALKRRREIPAMTPRHFPKGWPPGIRMPKTDEDQSNVDAFKKSRTIAVFCGSNYGASKEYAEGARSARSDPRKGRNSRRLWRHDKGSNGRCRRILP